MGLLVEGLRKKTWVPEQNWEWDKGGNGGPEREPRKGCGRPKPGPGKYIVPLEYEVRLAGLIS